jgi:hypothetical protein
MTQVSVQRTDANLGHKAEHFACFAKSGDVVACHRISSSGSGTAFGAVRRNFIKPAPLALPARFLKKSAAVSTTPTFCATVAAIH